MTDNSNELERGEKPFGEIRTRARDRFGNVSGGVRGGGFHALLNNADRERGFLSKADRERLLEMQNLDLSDTTQRNARTRIRNRVLSAYFDARYLRYVHERDRGLIFQNARKEGYDLHFREGFKEFVRFTYRGLLEDDHDIDITEILEAAIQQAEQEYATAAGENVNIQVDIDVTRAPGDSIEELEQHYTTHDYLDRHELEVLVTSDHTNDSEDVVDAADIDLVDALYYDARQPDSDPHGYSWEDPNREEAEEIVDRLQSMFEECDIETYDELDEALDRLTAFDEEVGQELRRDLNHLSRAAPNFSSQMASGADLPEQDVELLHDIIWNPDNIGVEKALEQKARPPTAGEDWDPAEDEYLQEFIARVEATESPKGGEEGPERWNKVLELAEFDPDEWSEYMEEQCVERARHILSEALGATESITASDLAEVETYDDLVLLFDRETDQSPDVAGIGYKYGEEAGLEAARRIATEEGVDEQ